VAERRHLRALAEELGVVSGYRGADGVWRETSDATRIALLAAMRVEAASEKDADAVLRERRRARAAQLVEPVRVARRGDAGTGTLAVARRGPFVYELEIFTESGRALRTQGSIGKGSPPVLPLPEIREDGRHKLRLRVRGGGREAEAEQTYLLVPATCMPLRERLEGERGFGLLANLYSVVDGRGDFGDLKTLTQLVRWAGRTGAAFVGVNPLNAIRAGGTEISPYSPTTRVFRSFLYLDLEAIPEMRDCAAAQRSVRRKPDGGAFIDYDAARRRRLEVLRRLHRVFLRTHADAGSERRRAYDRFVVAGGELLAGFATFCALDEHFGTDAGGTEGWRAWPASYRDPQGAAVRRFAREHAEVIGFHLWVQFEIDRQLGAVARSAERAGLPLGIYQDLPIGAVPSGCEEWLLRSLFCTGASVGAPPDAFFAGGQNWGLAPIDPQTMRGQGYAYWSALLRAAFAHSGALRIDHIMGLARQYWVPEGMTARDGAYVRMPADELFGVLALESRRAAAVVIGEDLGTVPEEIPPLLERWGVLSTKVLYFERTARGGFRAAGAYPRRAFVSANTHDLATLAGYERGLDVELNQRAGVLDDELAAQMRGVRGREVAALRRWAKAGKGDALMGPVYAQLAKSPAMLVGVALDDLGGEVEPVNLPGVPGAIYPSWRRRMQRTLGQIAADPDVAATLASVRAARGRGSR
jgi:4-alpha-glucanotransferase